MRREYQTRVSVLHLLRQKIDPLDPFERGDGAAGQVCRQIRRFGVINGFESEDGELYRAVSAKWKPALEALKTDASTELPEAS